MANRPRKSTRVAATSRPAWLVFVGGAATGVFATLLVTTFILPARLTPGTLALRPVAANVKRGAVAGPVPRAPITYDFDGELKSSEVPVPARNAPVPARGATPGTAPAPAPATAPNPLPQRMLLQAGSFRAAGDADSLRAELLLLAVGSVSTRDTLLPSGEVWHRVLIGPFNDATVMGAVRDRLARQNIDTFPIAVPAAAPRPKTTPAPASPAPPSPAPSAP